MRREAKYLWILVVLSGSCATRSEVSDSVLNGKDTTDVIHFNIVIAPDLSNRLNKQLYPKPVLDNEIVKIILSRYPDGIAKYRRLDGQRDKIRVSFINTAQVSRYNVSPSEMQIDLSIFERQIDRIDYLRGKSEKSFKNDTVRFVKAFESLINRAQSEQFGSDIWSYLANLDDYWIYDGSTMTELNKKVYRHSYRNILILLTDGYIEAGIYKNGGCPIDLRSCMFLSKERIEEFRKAYRLSKNSNLTDFFIESGFEIRPVQNSRMKKLEVLVLEVYDRSLTKGGTPTVYPADMDILTLFWSKWLKDSGVSRFQIEANFASREEAQETILDFILSDHAPDVSN